MIHPVFRLAVAQPMLLASHVGAYAGLVSEDLLISGVALRRRLLWQLTGALCLTVAAVLAGVAVLLWAALPAGGSQTVWLFVATPMLPTILGLWAWWHARGRTVAQPWARLRVQLAEDAAMLARHPAP